MFKFVVITLVVIWLAGFLLGGKRRLVRDANHLLRLILWACLSFIGSTALTQAQGLKEHAILYALAVIVVFAACWPASGWLAARLGRKGR